MIVDSFKTNTLPREQLYKEKLRKPMTTLLRTPCKIFTFHWAWYYEAQATFVHPTHILAEKLATSRDTSSIVCSYWSISASNQPACIKCTAGNQQHWHTKFWRLL